MDKLLAKARRDRERLENRPTVFGLTGWRSVLYYLYYRNRYFFMREAGMWLFNLLELGLAAWLLGGLQARGLALAGRYVQLLCVLWGAVTFAERILVSRYHAAGMPERIARTVATFIQAGFVAGLLLFLGLRMAAPFLVSSGIADDAWTLLLFKHRAALLIPELISGSIFAGAYTLSRMYRPLSLTFLARLAVVLSNIFLFPVFGEPVLLVNLYLPRILDLAVTAWVARRWAFDRNRVPSLPLMTRPHLNMNLVRELAPYVGGRTLGVLFATGYGLIILQAVSWLLPRELIFYVLFYQAMGLLYLVPRRLGRSIYFDISQLLIWNRLGVLKDYIQKLDRISTASGVVLSALCVMFGFAARAGWGSSRFASMAPLIFAAIPFLIFHPQNAVWQSVRDASGEIRFNNTLLLCTNYLVALPVNLWILLGGRGEFNTVDSFGMTFVVVTHTLLFVRVLLVDGAVEAVRAILSRIHVFRFRWVEDSPLRVTRSLMDSELSFADSHALKLSFSRDLSDLWGERFLRAREQGFSSLPYMGYAIARFLRSPTLATYGFGLLRMTIDRSSRNEWRPGGEASQSLLAALRSVDCACRVAPGRLAVFFPCVNAEGLRHRVADINATSGIFLRELSCCHSLSTSMAHTSGVLQWITSTDQDDATEDRSALQHAWRQTPALFGLRRGRDDDAEVLFSSLCSGWQSSEQKGLSFSDYATDGAVRLLCEFTGQDAAWHPSDHWTGQDGTTPADMRLISNVVRYLDMHRAPDFHAFLKANALHVLPIFLRTNLAGFFTHAPRAQAEQARLVRVSAAFYLWATLRSIEDVRWEDRDGLTIAPVFNAALDDARKLHRALGIPFMHRFAHKPRGVDTLAWIADAKQSLGPGGIIRRTGRRFELLAN